MQFQKVYILTLFRNIIISALGVSVSVEKTCFIDPFINLYSRTELEKRSRNDKEIDFIVSLKFEFLIRNISIIIYSFS